MTIAWAFLALETWTRCFLFAPGEICINQATVKSVGAFIFKFYGRGAYSGEMVWRTSSHQTGDDPKSKI
jgi:hypothetical protein